MTEQSALQLFVAWVPYQRRQASMAPYLGFETVFMPVGQGNRIRRPIQYLRNAVRTFLLFRKRRPRVIWVQLPQVPLLTVALTYKRLMDPAVRIIADCHNRILNPPWKEWPGLTAQLNACDVVVVHNTAVVQKVLDLGVRAEIVRLLEDPPAVVNLAGDSGISVEHPWVLFLASFNPDEPVLELLEAARLAPEINFVLAGDTSRASGRHELADLPGNVVLSGYLSGSALDGAISCADAVLALTKLPDAQLSSAAEAIGAGRPMVISDTPVTRELYYKGGVFVDTYSGAAIAQGCRTVVAEQAKLAAESLDLREERILRWRGQANAIQAFVEL